MLAIEHTWARSVVAAVRESGAEVIANERIPADVVNQGTAARLSTRRPPGSAAMSGGDPTFGQFRAGEPEMVAQGRSRVLGPVQSTALKDRHDVVDELLE